MSSRPPSDVPSTPPNTQADEPTSLQQGRPSEPPPPPIPSSDPELAHPASQAQTPPDADDDLFKLSSSRALKLLAAGLEALVRITGDIPPTPPPTSPTIPNMRGMQAEKDSIVRSHSERSLARMRQQAEAAAAVAAPTPVGEKTARQEYQQPLSPAGTSALSQSIDGVHLREPTLTPTSTPPPRQPSPYIIIGADAQPLNLQHSAIARKFYGKQPPRVSILDYLTRLHRFCPMSTAVYLATSLYIHRLAVEERAIPVAHRNVHRLVLGGLRVAMKALEDQSYAHAKMAKVGGVSEAELARLEIHFCFLTNFELAVTEEALRMHWEILREGRALEALGGAREVPVLRLERRRRGRNSEEEEPE